MTTLVPGPVRRQVGLDSFAGFTDARVVACDERAGVTFDADLDAATVASIGEFIRSRDDDDQARRAALRADCDALPADDPLRRLYDYVLGDSGL